MLGYLNQYVSMTGSIAPGRSSRGLRQREVHWHRWFCLRKIGLWVSAFAARQIISLDEWLTTWLCSEECLPDLNLPHSLPVFSVLPIPTLFARNPLQGVRMVLSWWWR